MNIAACVVTCARLKPTGNCKTPSMKYFLTIAASDNSGGAGIQQDLKVAEELGYWGLSAITGITTQNFEKLDGVYPISPEILSGQIEINIQSFQINCIKIGAICSEKNIIAISDILQKYKLKNIVLDPVFSPSNGKEFLQSKSVKLFREKLLPYINIVTPNRIELSLLAEKEILNFEEGLEASKELNKRFNCNVYIKGGHFESNSIKEALVTHSEVNIFEKERLSLNYSHGTGCTFSTALSCFLGDNIELKYACIKASEFVSRIYQKLEIDFQ
jgi:hydroxymethylpyrimidine/phosphomethylpyrimidine kinase